MITWWIAGKQIRDGFHIQTSPDGNVSMSTLSFMPTVLDAGSQLVCRAGNPGLADSTLEDSWKLEVHCESYLLITAFSNNGKCIKSPVLKLKLYIPEKVLRSLLANLITNALCLDLFEHPESTTAIKEFGSRFIKIN